MGLDGVMWVTLYGLIRLLLWGAGVGIALFPTLQAVHFLPSWHFAGTMDYVNAQGRFRDLFFVIVPASAVSLSTTVDYLCARPRNEINALLAVISLILNVVILLSGFVGFALIPEKHVPLAADIYILCSWIIICGLVVSLTTELWISGAVKHQERHRNPRKS